MNDEDRTANLPVLPVGMTSDGSTQAGTTSASVLQRSHRFTVPGYEICEELGRGGMGVVYRAEQQSLGRDIALKFLREEYHPTSRSGIRFLEEARITANLQHPGIPAIHEVGTLPDDRPFLVMKLIRGETLDTMLKREGPHPTRWLSIFEGICQAVGYAHSRNIIHRDLKPANVMVGAFGEVQVMDWGLAKLLGTTTQQLSEVSCETASSVPLSHSQSATETLAGSLLGTPAYMAPEQALGAVEQIDTRSDVFGLGAVLCALMTGQPPYVNRTIETTRQMAVNVDLAEANQRIDTCGASPEIVALCRRCLSANRDERPATGAELAEEISRIRRDADERAATIEREKAEAAVKAEEQRKRRRVMQFAIGAVVLALTSGAIVSLMQASRARTERDNAKNAESMARSAERKANESLQAETAARKEAETVSTFFQDVLSQGSAQGQLGMTRQVNRNLTVKAAMDTAAKEIAGRFAATPLLEASIQNTIGRTYYELGEYAPAVEHYKQAAMIYAKSSSKGEEHVDTLRVFNNMAVAYQHLGDFKSAEEFFSLVQRSLEKQYGPKAEVTLLATSNLAMLYEAKREYPKAEEMLRSIVAEANENLGPKNPRTLTFINNLGTVLFKQERYDEAEPLFRQAYEARRELLSLEHPDTLVSLGNLANLYEAKRDFKQAESLYRTALATCEQVLGPDHPATLLVLNNLGYTLESAGRINDAEAMYRKALDGREAKLGPVHSDTLTTLGNLAHLYASQTQYGKADPIYRRMAATLERMNGLADVNTLEVMEKMHAVWESLARQEECRTLAGRIAEGYRALKKEDRAKTWQSRSEREQAPLPRKK